jgi:hypothetical protein
MTDEIIAPPVFVDGSKRSETVPLDWPIEYNGTVYSAVSVRRLTVADIRKMAEADEPSQHFPMYDVPNEVLDMLDADDATKLNEVTGRFLPRSFRGAE